MVALLHAGRAAVPMHIPLEREGKCWSVFPPPRLRLAMFCGPVSLELIISTGLDLVHPEPAITHSACLHESRYVIGADSLSLTSPCAGCTGAGCRVHPEPAITHSACLHEIRYVVGADSLSLTSPCAGCTGAGCRVSIFFWETWWDSLGVT